MNTKKYIILTTATALLMGGAMMVSAENTATTTVVKPEKPMVVEIGPGGRTLLRGTVTVVGTNSLTVKSWGGDWTINISASTKLAPKTDVSQFQVGDFVGVQGLASTTALWTIDATLVRNRTLRQEVKEERKENKEERKENSSDIQGKIQSILEQIKKLQAQMGTQ